MWNFGGSAYAAAAFPSNMGGVAEAESPKQAERLCCILVHAPDVVPPTRLNRALEAKRVEVAPTSDVYGALVDLCALCKDEAVALPILAIVEPESVAHAAALFEAASVYAGRAVFWVYASSPHEQIREVREQDLAAWGRGSENPGTRMGHEADSPGGDGAEGAGGGEQNRGGSRTGEESTPRRGSESDSILTDEELEMLLADDPPDPDER